MIVTITNSSDKACGICHYTRCCKLLAILPHQNGLLGSWSRISRGYKEARKGLSIQCPPSPTRHLGAQVSPLTIEKLINYIMISSNTPPGLFAAPQSSLPRARDAPHVIAFLSPANRRLSGASNSQSQYSMRLAPDTLAWYYSLTSRSVQTLQLHKGDSYFIVLVMRDDSRFRLEYAQSSPLTHATGVVGTIARIPDAIDLTPTQWISIDLIRASSPATRAPDVDMRFILSICFGAFQQLRRLQPGHNLLFILALTTSVARKCIQMEESLIDSAGTSLDQLWREVYSTTQPTSHSLWEEKIANEGRNEVRKWLFQAARERVESVLLDGPTTNPSADSNNDEIENHNHKRIFAASVVAWLEFSAPKIEASVLATWDAEWDANWHKIWKAKWETSWEEQSVYPQMALIQLGKIVNISNPISSDFTTAIRASGRLSGGIAGSASVEVTMASKASEIPKNSLLERERSIARQARPNDEGKPHISCSSECSISNGPYL